MSSNGVVIKVKADNDLNPVLTAGLRDTIPSGTVDSAGKHRRHSQMPRPDKLVYQKAIVKARPKAGFTFRDFCERIQIHGLLDWYTATSGIAKCFWLSLIVIFSVILVLEIQQAVNEYYTNPIKTTISLMPTDFIDMPPIYICPLNYIDNDKVENENLGEVRDSLWPYIVQPRVANLFTDIQKEWKKAHPLIAIDGEVSESRFRKTLSVARLHDDLSSISFNASEIVRHCEFQAVRIDCEPMVRAIVDKDYGVCYLVTPNLTQTIAGAGLRMLVDIHADNYMIDNIDTFYQGAVIRFGKDAKPFTLGGSFASPGKYVKYGLEKIHEKLITVRSSATPQICHEGEFPFKFLNTSYSKLACTVECLMKKTFPKCHCLPKLDPTYMQSEWHDTAVCNVSMVTQCLLPLVLDPDQRSECLGQCYRRCEDYSFKVHESSMLLSSPQLRDYFQLIGETGDEGKLPKAARPEYWEKSMILIEVAFDTMEVMSVVQSPAATITDLVSGLGGQVGLWLGASMFSLIQVAALLLSWCYTKIETRRTSKKDGDGGNLGVITRPGNDEKV